MHSIFISKFSDLMESDDSLHVNEELLEIKVVVEGDTVINGKIILLFSSNEHLKILARSKQILGDVTFRITPSLW